MLVTIKNFKKNEDCNLTAISVKYFMPEAKIYLFNFFESSNQSLDDELRYKYLDMNIFEEIIDVKTNYVLGSGMSSKNNGLYYSESINVIYNYFKDFNDKLLFLDENHFFTNGNTLKELEINNFDIAWCDWLPGPDNLKKRPIKTGVNASILCFIPSKIRELFPIPEYRDYIEKKFSKK